jgi:hypothetical protein
VLCDDDVTASLHHHVDTRDLHMKEEVVWRIESDVVSTVVPLCDNYTTIATPGESKYSPTTWSNKEWKREVQI